ncbi:MAG: prolyl oligopeptidase family serine peptidase [Casimicrobiaceae bacterium]
MACAAIAAERTFFPPATPARPVVETLHGVTLTDQYRWLEDGKSAEVAAWTQQQHAATLAWLDRAAPPVPGLKEELTQIIDRDVTQPPFFKKDREFFLRTRKGESQAKFYTRIDGRDVLLFDPVLLDPSGNTSLGPIIPNREGSKAAVATYAKGTELTDYRIIDTTTGAQVGSLIPGVRDFSWARDERYAYLSPRTAQSIAKQEPQRCYRHRLGSDPKDDELLLAMDDAKQMCQVYEPEDADVTVFETGTFWANTIRIRPLGSTAEPRTIWSSTKFSAEATFRRDRIYIRTNDNAPNWKLMGASYDRPEAADWQPLVAEGDTVLEGFDVTSQWILVRDKKDVLTRMFVHDLAGKRVRELALPELGNVTGTAYNRDRDVVYANIASFTLPRKVWTIAGGSLDFTPLWQDDPPIDTSGIVAERKFVPAKDGAMIPIFIVHRKDWKTDGNAPVYLYGYGGFNIGIEPFYIGTLASFVNRGGVFVEAGIRGGNEYGERWHEQAMLGSKQSSFDDFAAVAQWLASEKITNPQRLVIGGGSNGGLLIGAMLTQRPDLFHAAICSVPLLDMVRFHKFLVARYWITEYGDPDKADDFRWLLRYSPYHNVRQGIDLPATLVTAGEYDSRVDPLHAKKFVAAVQNNPGQASPFLLYMDFDSGHGFGKARAKAIEDRDYQMRFLMHELGMFR